MIENKNKLLPNSPPILEILPEGSFVNERPQSKNSKISNFFNKLDMSHESQAQISNRNKKDEGLPISKEETMKSQSGVLKK